MLYLTYENPGKITLSLAGKTTLVNPYYTFRMIDKTSKEEIVFTANDISQVPEFYNQFIITVGTASGLTAGIVPAPPSQYTLEVYEMALKYDLDINNAIGKVNTNILNIVGTYSLVEVYNNQGTPTEVYKNQNRV